MNTFICIVGVVWCAWILLSMVVSVCDFDTGATMIIFGVGAAAFFGVALAMVLLISELVAK